jgi:hypothetical protein
MWNRGLIAMVGRQVGSDTCWDIGRTARLPESINQKTGKAKRGYQRGFIKGGLFPTGSGATRVGDAQVLPLRDRRRSVRAVRTVWERQTFLSAIPLGAVRGYGPEWSQLWPLRAPVVVLSRVAPVAAT